MGREWRRRRPTGNDKGSLEGGGQGDFRDKGFSRVVEKDFFFS